MKNKLIINIILVYFALLAVVLVVQMKTGKNKNISTEPLKDNASYGEILGGSVVLYDRSPVMLVKQKQKLVNSENAACVPVIENDRMFVPLSFFEEAFGAVVSADKNRSSATVRLNNKALVVDDTKGIITLVSASGEKELKAGGEVKLKNNTVYIPLDGFSEGFDKQLLLYGSMALLSDKDPKLGEKEKDAFAAAVEVQVNNLPSVDEQKKLEELLGSGAVNIFNTIGETLVSDQKENPVSTLGLDAIGANTPSDIKADAEYIYFLRDKSIDIARTGEKPVTVSTIELQLDEIYGIYVSGSYLSVVGEGKALADEESSFNGCTIAVYDITDKTAPKLVRQVGAEGGYTGAYKNGDTVYLFVKKDADSADSFGMPDYYDSANASVGASESLSSVRYVPEMADKAYTSVLGFNINDMGRALNVYTLLGCGDNISLTGDSLYIAAPSGEGTSIYRLALNDGTVKYAAAGFNEGSVPNAACMNEYNGTLRLAACLDDKVQVTLFDNKMDIKDSLDDVAVDGNMVSARFIGGRGYLVTDSETKPVYAVALDDKAEEIGAIKLPEGTFAVRNLDAEHFVCFKDGSISMLNIADINNCFEVFDVVTDVWSDRDKIILNSQENVLVVPAERYAAEADSESTTELVTEQTTAGQTESSTETATMAEQLSPSKARENGNKPVWQGVYVYTIDMQQGFVPAAQITHTAEDGEGAEQSTIKSVLYKDGRLYTVSDNEIKSTYIK